MMKNNFYISMLMSSVSISWLGDGHNGFDFRWGRKQNEMDAWLV